MKNIINKLSNIGVSSVMTTEQKGLLQLSNKLAWIISLLSTFLGILALINSVYYIAISDFLLGILVFIPIVLNYYKRHTAAKLVLIFNLIFWIIGGAIFYSYNSVFKYGIILPISLTFIFFADGGKWKLYIPLILALLSLILFEMDKFHNLVLFDNNYHNYLFVDKFTGHLFDSMMFMSVIIVFIIMQSHFLSFLKKKESELLIYKKIFDYSHEAISITDINGVYIKQNQAHSEISGFTDEELIGKTPAMHTGDKLFGEMVESITKQGHYRGEFISNTKNGDKYTDLKAFLIRENSQAVCVVAINRDITQQNMIKTALEASEKRYRTLVNLMGEGLGIVNFNKQLVFANPQMEKIFDVEPGTLINRDVLRFFNQEQLDILFQQSIIRSQGVISTYKLILNTDRNQEKHVHVTAAPFIEGEEISGSIIVVVDITERENMIKAMKEGEENLLIANATKDKFFSIIGHDLRSPFNALIGFSNIMIENESTVEEMKWYAKVINETSVSTLQLLDNLLDWSRLQTNNLVPNMQKTNLGELISNSFLSLESKAAEKHVELTSQLEPDIYAAVDTNMIETVIRNLTSNAIKYCNEGDAISIVLEKTDGTALISVKDTGIGINEEVLSKLFKIGYSISTKGTHCETGTGLGLILCKEFVEKNDGEISVESELGKGSVFKVKLPLKQ